MWIPPRGCLKHKCLVSLFNKRALYPLQLDVHSFLGHIFVLQENEWDQAPIRSSMHRGRYHRQNSFLWLHPRHSFWCPSSQLPAGDALHTHHRNACGSPRPLPLRCLRDFVLVVSPSRSWIKCLTPARLNVRRWWQSHFRWYLTGHPAHHLEGSGYDLNRGPCWHRIQCLQRPE